MAKQKEELNGLSALYEHRVRAASGIAPCDAEFEKRWPILFSLMSNNRVGKERFTAPVRLGLANSSGDWCVSLSAPGLQCYGEVLCKTFLDGLDGLEALLGRGAFPWKTNTVKDVKVKEIKIPKS